MEGVNIAYVAFLVSEECSITHYRLKDFLDLWQNEEVTAINGHQYGYDVGFLWIAGSAILALPQTQNIAGGKISGFERKALNGKTIRIQKFSDSKFPSRFKISGDTTKTGCFQFGVGVGKTNPVLKRLDNFL